MRRLGRRTAGSHTHAVTSWPQRAGLVLLGLVLSSLLLELGLRLAGVAWLRRREREHQAAMADRDAIRVLCLGESTTAFGGDRSYPSQLQTLLNARGGGRRFRVINVGVPGTTTTEVLARLPDQLERYQPHLVVAMIGVNDGLVQGRDDAPPTLPAPDALRVVKLVQLLWFHGRARLAAWAEATPDARMAATLRRPPAEAEALLRAGVARPDPRPEDVKGLAILLASQTRFDEARDLLQQHLSVRPGDPVLTEMLRDMRIAGAGQRLRAGRLDEGERELRAVFAALPDGAAHDRALILARLATIAEVRGDRDEAERLRREAAAARRGSWLPTTEENYRGIARLLRERDVPLVAVQYPLRPLDGLREMLGDPPDVVFVDTEQAFRAALGRAPYDAWFTDAFAGDFGHTTDAGAGLLAERVAHTILARLATGTVSARALNPRRPRRSPRP